MTCELVVSTLILLHFSLRFSTAFLNASNECDDATFGPSCQYKCHCKYRNTCLSSGDCVGYGCDQGWFGQLCQYSDMASESLQTTPTIIEKTHSVYSHTVHFEWKSSFYFTWMRVVFHNAINFSMAISVKFTKQRSDGERYDSDCPDSFTDIKNNTLEYYCDDPLLTNKFKVVLTVNETILTPDFHISGGRELRPKDVSSKSDELRSVAGGSTLSMSTCEYLLNSKSTVTRILLPNLDPAGTVYDIDIHSEHGVMSIKVRAITQDGSGSFTFNPSTVLIGVNRITVNYKAFNGLTECNIHIFGEIDCAHGLFGLDCEQICNCQGQGCFLSTGDCKIQKVLDHACPKGFYGPTCQNRCPTTCGISGCEVNSGHCVDCLPGFLGNMCHITCNATYFGNNCEERCSHLCSNQLCHPETGHCQNCPDGRRGYFCDEDCPNNLYGRLCAFTCPVNCLGGCEKTNGYCRECIPGYQGNQCHRPCDVGYYGPSCKMVCLQTCQEFSCDHVNGHCSLCRPGYSGSFCEQECEKGKHGVNCMSSCQPKCKDGCNIISGECQGCDLGYVGKFCDDVCLPGYYGQNCSMKCSSNCSDDLCHHGNGKCYKCPSGRIGDYCERDCPKGFYGNHCELRCPLRCLNQECQVTIGHCLSCPAGFTGVMCDSDCPQGSYGQSCSQTCPANCDQNICDPTSGQCLNCKIGFQGRLCDHACPPTYYGAQCREKCSEQCRDRQCHHETGKCIKCYPGTTGDFCLQLCPSNTYGEDCIFLCNPGCKANISAPLDICHHVTGVCSYREEVVKTEKEASEKSVWVGISCTVVIGCIIVALVCLFQKRRMNLMPVAENTRKKSFVNMLFSVQDEHRV